MGKSLITGLDINPQTINAVVLKPDHDTLSLVGYHQIKTDTDIFTENHRLNYQKIVKKLKELRKVLPLFSRKVCLYLPDEFVISKKLQIDREFQGEECEFALIQAFSLRSPVPVDELYFDFVALPDKPGEFQVYAARKSCIENRMSSCQKAGFDPVVINAFSDNLIRVWRWATAQQSLTDWALVDITEAGLTICFVFPQQEVFFREIHHDDLEHQEGLHVAVETLQHHIHLLNSMHCSPLSGLWLSGEKRRRDRFIDEWHKRSLLPVRMLSLLELFPHGLKSPAWDGAEFIRATGLALSGVAWLER
ncbi:type IV pilus assembly protein PilM [Vibrio ostreicida]|uniref:Type IV pilus assembly protein PilM n=1 Tax=Vibrio ostreicida TaxID=526588 RepID=A0ABT8BMQ0_9VIBR|nr:type IV pilus assembly protein PilM [Vibrio ostreicida]MDN3608411.1 type IV pilus assembly protein PilM [Vibrio ostreicida]NPD10233.1 type IV pilus assembly protein PilM [Vibrio ostreicida]